MPTPKKVSQSHARRGSFRHVGVEISCLKDVKEGHIRRRKARLPCLSSSLRGEEVKGSIRVLAAAVLAAGIVFGAVSMAKGGDGGGANVPCPPGQYCGSPDGPSQNGTG